MNANIRAMNDAALRVEAAYEKDGAPFGLFLSSWSFDEARKLRFEMTGRQSSDVQVRLGLERQFRYVLQQDELATVAIYRKGDDARILEPESWPAFTMTNDTWRDRVESLARRADLIVVFWGVTGDGLSEELEICTADTNRLKTVAIVAVEPHQIFLHQMHQTFPRIVPLNEVPTLPNPMHPELEPLIARMRTLRALAPSVRAGLIEPSVRVARFPLPSTSKRFDRPIWFGPSDPEIM